MEISINSVTNTKIESIQEHLKVGLIAFCSHLLWHLVTTCHTQIWLKYIEHQGFLHLHSKFCWFWTISHHPIIFKLTMIVMFLTACYLIWRYKMICLMSHMQIINFLCTQDPNVRFVNSLNEAVSHLVVIGFDIVRYLA